MTTFARLEDVVLDEVFPEVDLILRRGRHIDADDRVWYTFLLDAQEHLEPWYRRFGCELVHRSDGYFYLLPTSDKLGRRHLSSGEMLVGQALTLLYLDPAMLEHGGIVTRDQLLSHLAGVMGVDSLMATLNPKRRRLDERVAQETVRTKVAEAVRRLSTLGFVDLVDEQQIRLRRGLLRFAEPVRGVAAPEAELERLVAEGELVLTDAASGGAEPSDGEDADDATDAADAGDGSESADTLGATNEPNSHGDSPDSAETADSTDSPDDSDVSPDDSADSDARAPSHSTDNGDPSDTESGATR